MTIEQLRTLHQARPFKPFTINLADGRAIPVLHNEFLSRSPSGRTIIVHQPDDSFELIDYLLITSLEVQPGTSNTAQGA
jgi:hypothetical protein